MPGMFDWGVPKLMCALLFAGFSVEWLSRRFIYSTPDYRDSCALSTAERMINRNIQGLVLGAVLRFNKRMVAEDPFATAILAYAFFPCAVGLCVIAYIPCLLYDQAGNLVDRGTKVKTVILPWNRGCTHWPPPLVIPESLDERIGDSDTPRQFVCPLTFSIMRQPAVTPYGTTYDYEAVTSWADAKGRYPAHESNQPLSRSDLAPNRALRGMIEEWVAARSTVSCDQPARDAQV